MVPGLGGSPGGGHSNPLQYSCLENPMDREPGGLWSMALQRVRHGRSDLACSHKGSNQFSISLPKYLENEGSCILNKNEGLKTRTLNIQRVIQITHKKVYCVSIKRKSKPARQQADD